MNPLDDYIDQCMDDTGVEASFGDFMEAYCKRCLNPSCKRSRMNDLQWQQRMDRQVKALQTPDFVNPEDPEYKPLADQAFESYEKQQVRLQSWDSFEEPQQFQGKKEPEPKQKEPIIHRANPASENHDSGKIDDSVNRLATAKGKDVANTKPPENVVQEQEPEPQPEPQVSEPEPDTPQQPVQVAKRDQPTPPAKEGKKELADSTRSGYNTEVPEGGILLKPKEEVMKPSQKAQQPNKDAWSIPSEGKETLVVRASDGKLVDKTEKVDKGRSDKYKGRSESEEKD